MAKSQQNSEKSEEGERLEAVMLKYFGKQKTLAEKIGVAPNSISKLILGYTKMTKSTAMKMQDLAGISANYLLYGEEPMMVEENAKPEKDYEVKYEGDAPILPLTQRSKYNNRGTARHYILNAIGRREVLSLTGEANVADLVLDGIKEPSMITIISPEFYEKYNIKNGSVLVVSDKYFEGETVLLRYEVKYYLAKVVNPKLFVDIKDKSKKFSLSSSIEIIGTVFCKIDYF